MLDTIVKALVTHKNTSTKTARDGYSLRLELKNDAGRLHYVSRSKPVAGTTSTWISLWVSVSCNRFTSRSLDAVCFPKVLRTRCGRDICLSAINIEWWNLLCTLEVKKCRNLAARNAGGRNMMWQSCDWRVRREAAFLRDAKGAPMADHHGAVCPPLWQMNQSWSTCAWYAPLVMDVYPA